jgi:hypothetical protein
MKNTNSRSITLKYDLSVIVGLKLYRPNRYMAHLAPSGVLNALSSDSKMLLQARKQGDNLTPYIEIAPNLRVRGLKSTLLYSTYSMLDNNHILQPHYTVLAEEAQTNWALKVKTRANKINNSVLNTKAVHEVAWIIWEDDFMAAAKPAPLSQPQFYVDLTGNTYIHMLAYACVNRTHVDIEEYERQFSAADFATSSKMFTKNERQLTPLMILMDHPLLYDFVESLLLRIFPEMRFTALPLNYWQSAWGTLNNAMITDNIGLFIEQSKKQSDLKFFQKFTQLTFSNRDASLHLFNSGYKLQPLHFTASDIPLIRTILDTRPDWHNTTLILHSVLDMTNPERQFAKVRHLLHSRIQTIRDEILSIVFHPDRIGKYIGLGYMPGSFDSIM